MQNFLLLSHFPLSSLLPHCLHRLSISLYLSPHSLLAVFSSPLSVAMVSLILTFTVDAPFTDGINCHKSVREETPQYCPCNDQHKAMGFADLFLISLLSEAAWYRTRTPHTHTLEAVTVQLIYQCSRSNSRFV